MASSIQDVASGLALAIGLAGCGDLLAELDAALEDQPFRDKGVFFKHPAGWTVTVEDHDTVPGLWKMYSTDYEDRHVFIDVILDEVDLPVVDQAKLCAARTLVDKKSFAKPSYGQVSSTPISRVIAGRARTGERHAITVEWKMDSDDDIVCDVYVFEHDGKTVSIAAGGPAKDHTSAELDFATILDSFALEG